MIELGSRQTLIIAILVLFLGKWLNKKIPFLRNYNIPEPVTGGVLASLFFGAFYFLADKEFSFALGDRDTLFLVFFSALGLSARLQTLIDGGKVLAILLVSGIAFLFMQNFIGLGVAEATSVDPLVGLLGGSVSLSGGFGTTIAWSQVFQNSYGLENAPEIGIACATFGLLLGGLVGGPIAGYLIKKNNLHSESTEELAVGVRHEKVAVSIDYFGVLNTVLIIAVTMGIGINFNILLSDLGFKIPAFVSCLVAGLVLTNTVPYIFKRIAWPTNTPSLALISDLSLGLFLAMSLMSLKLWTLIDLAGPIMLLLIAQVILLSVFVVFVIFRLMGRDYDAAIISAGFAGLGLGATPTAFANMTAVTKRFGASPKAFIIIPLVGPFVGGITNSFVIKFLVDLIH